MTKSLHLDEAWDAAVKQAEGFTRKFSGINSRTLLLHDLFGRIRIVLWPKAKLTDEVEELRAAMLAAAGKWWSGEIIDVHLNADSTSGLFETAWQEAQQIGQTPEFRVNVRHRNRGFWFTSNKASPWEVSPQAPPIVLFYSFKGGVGRSSALVSFAMQRAQQGERVVVLDMDFDAPGVGQLLATDELGSSSPWGLVDFLLENSVAESPLPDYFHACRREKVVGKGEILVFPAGKIDENYLAKLSRVDFEPQDGAAHPAIDSLLNRIKDELKPTWILIDSRTGLSIPAGVLLAGIAHLHVLFSSTSKQNALGMSLVLQKLGADRIHKRLPQADCILVQAMVPRDTESGKIAMEHFLAQAREDFSHHFYAVEPQIDDEDIFWDMSDIDSADAPHVPIAIPYEPALAHFKDLVDVAETLTGPPYGQLAQRIVSRFILDSETT